MPLAMDLVASALYRLCNGTAVNHVRRRVAMRNHTLLHYMAGGDHTAGVTGIKVYSSTPGVGVPNFVVLLFDSRTSELLAEIEANALGQIRTGAASGVATRRLARENACRLAQFGTGFQAETQLEAVACARELEWARVYSRSSERRERFAERMAERLGIDVRPAAGPEAALEGADIVTTVTNSPRPVFPGALLRPGTHINAVGSNHVLRRELDAETIRKCGLITVDSLEQARMEAGDLTQAAEEGALDWNRVIELHEILAVTQPGRTTDYEITLFESQGLAVEDIALADHLYRLYR